MATNKLNTIPITENTNQELTDKRCLHCHVPMKSARKNKRFCGPRCYGRATLTFTYPDLLDSHKSCTLGAISELAVIRDLMIKGFDVFKAVDPGSPYDLVVIINTVPLTVQVKTGHRQKSTTTPIAYAKVKQVPDILAVVCSDEIIYSPELDKLP